MRPLRARRAWFPLVAAVALACGCSAGGASETSMAATTAPSTAGPVTTRVAAATTPTSALSGAPTAATPTADALAFFRAQETACRAHADGVGNPVVEPDRFSGATQLGDLGGGAYLVEDGRGTRLVVRPEEGVVLPESGNPTDLMPPPYGFGCPEDVFVGGADA